MQLGHWFTVTHFCALPMFGFFFFESVRVDQRGPGHRHPCTAVSSCFPSSCHASFVAVRWSFICSGSDGRVPEAVAALLPHTLMMDDAPSVRGSASAHPPSASQLHPPPILATPIRRSHHFPSPASPTACLLPIDYSHACPTSIPAPVLTQAHRCKALPCALPRRFNAPTTVVICPVEAIHYHTQFYISCTMIDISS